MRFLLLNEILEKREITIDQLSQLVHKELGDHRDYYEVAALITGGYLECTTYRQGARKTFEGASAIDREQIWLSQLKEWDVALTIYSMTLGPGQHKYQNVIYNNPPNILDEKIFPTAKAFLHFNTERQKRKDQIITLVIGVTVGIVTALTTYLMTSWNVLGLM